MEPYLDFELPYKNKKSYDLVIRIIDDREGEVFVKVGNITNTSPYK